jgi:hypothetical protein
VLSVCATDVGAHPDQNENNEEKQRREKIGLILQEGEKCV